MLARNEISRTKKEWAREKGNSKAYAEKKGRAIPDPAFVLYITPKASYASLALSHTCIE
jgi:hypothetical protein